MPGSTFISTIGFLALAVTGAMAQTTEYMDPSTGITFQRILKSNYTFGIALPKTFGSDFIGQITSSTSEGWASVSFGGRMINSLLLVVYPDGEKVTASLRVAPEYASPLLFKGGAILKPIPEGTSADVTGFSYTFLCQNCIVEGLTFDGLHPVASLAWATSTNPVTHPSNPSSLLNYHDFYGRFNADIQAASSVKFAEWAALASDVPDFPPAPPGSGNGTIPNAPVRKETYDYIVAGAGAAGIVAAERIAESGASVLLLERGGPSIYSTGGEVTMPWNDTVTIFDVPAIFRHIPSTPGTNAFCADTAAQAACVLGGGTAVNGMIFIRPPQRDFDDFPQGWHWDDVADAAERLYERNTHTLYPSADGEYYDGTIFDIASKSFESNGWTSVDGIEQPDAKHMIFSRGPCGIVNGLRGGPLRTYLPLAQSLKNFKLELHTKVIRAVRTNSTVTGVEVEVSGGRETVNINPGGKVILASGAMSTPRILFNSGIGPTEQIEIVASGNTLVRLPERSAWIDLPVGKRIQDHPLWLTTWNITGDAAQLPIVSEEVLKNPPEEMVEDFSHAIGVFVENDIRMEVFTDITPSLDNVTRYMQVQFYGKTTGQFNMEIFLTHGSTSRGELGITAEGATYHIKNPLMNTEGDREAISTFVEMLLEYSRRPDAAFVWPGPGGANATARDVLTGMHSGIHVVATAPIGTDDGREGGNAVVDLDTRVYGTDNLFVVDASINPSVPTGNTMAITMLVAEKAAEKILAFDTMNAAL
ncbi:FAD/NAD(P)-binding domain-containing protein [Durotheca rogersii]|uniref:FAD/NAD(P)-binding domain-containing protein n=1 Tax=Durotheca rogersii TaxID=419775 RepID=UPI00221F9CF5|nr:FAD/NAD(P)-binding domain-containing protein [Durotheca rogersii]KAI5859240.1 FAD/NAD(P)-binding domain-containing protein [Durotheca rogersii]